MMKNRKYEGFTLLEVMIAAMVIMIGLLGIASLIPAGRFQIARAMQKDMVANYGRAGLRTIMTSGYLKNSPREYINWSGGAAGAMPVDARIANEIRDDIHGTDFGCSDDLMSEMVVGEPHPTYYPNAAKTNFEWVATIFNLQNGYYEVSIAVSHKRLSRNDVPANTAAADETSVGGTLYGRYGDGSVALNAPMNVQPGEWVYVRAEDNSVAHWYKIVDFAPIDNGILAVSGPAWTSKTGGSGPVPVTVATPGKVQGVYMEVMSANIR